MRVDFTSLRHCYIEGEYFYMADANTHKTVLKKTMQTHKHEG